MTTSSVPVVQAESASPPVDAVGPSNHFLLKWMFQFLSPVKPLWMLACLWLALWVGAEVMANRQAGETINHINKIQTNSAAAGFWSWLYSADPDASLLRHKTIILVTIVCCY